MNDTLEKLLGDLTLSQLKELAGIVRPSVGSLSAKNRSDVIAEALAGSNSYKVILAAHKIETIAPHKHILPFRLSSDWDFSRVKASLKSAFPDIQNRIDPELELPLYGLVPQLCIFDDENENAYLKFNHLVDAYRWETVSKDEKLRRRFRRRHPVIVSFRTKTKIVSVEFMGYSQISLDDAAVNYIALAKEIVNILNSKTELTLSPCQIRPSMDALLKDPKSKVINWKHTLGDANGKITLSSSNEERGAAHTLLEYFRKHGLQLTLAEAKEVLGGDDTNDVVLFWQTYDLLTRLSFKDEIPEILIVWRGNDPSSSVIDSVLRELTTNAPTEPRKTRKTVDDFLEEVVPGSVIQPGLVAGRFSLSMEDALASLVSATDKGEYSLVFRLKGIDDTVLENFWRPRSADLPKVNNAEGLLIDASEPRNVEVAFRRNGVIL